MQLIKNGGNENCKYIWSFNNFNLKYSSPNKIISYRYNCINADGSKCIKVSKGRYRSWVGRQIWKNVYEHTIATGDHAWAPSSGMLPTEDDNDLYEEDMISNISKQPMIEEVNKIKVSNKATRAKLGIKRQQIDQLNEVVDKKSKSNIMKEDASSSCSIAEVMHIYMDLQETYYIN